MSWFASIAPLLGQAAGAPAPAFHEEAWFRAVIAALIMLAAWGVGKWLSKVWRMPDYAFRFGLILFALIAGTVVCVWRWPPKLGIDLKGGVILIYEVAEHQQATINLAEPLDRIRNYLDNKVEIETQIGVRGSNQILVTAATTADDTLDQIEQTVESIPFSDFKVATAGREPNKGQTTVVFDVASTTATEAVDTDKLIAALNRRINPGGQKEVVVRKFGDRQVEVIIPEVESREIELIKEKISTSGLLEFRILVNKVDHPDIIALAESNPQADELVTGGRVVAKWVKLDLEKIKPDEQMQTRTNRAGEIEALVQVDLHNVTGGYLSRAAAGHDEFGRNAVDFSFNTEGSVAFGDLTGENTPDLSTGFHRRLGIVLDGVLFSAPELRSAITSRGQITGSFALEEVQFLVEILNAGHLPAALDKIPVSQTSISPQLGQDTIRNGSITLIVATGLILLFMLVYYRFSGLVADIAVALNVLLVVALMITLNAAFTLAGLAGLVLSVGMAVDANVLIYERMREELQRGAALRMAIRNGFSRATRTIVDSNLTTLFTGFVLYAIGTDQLKGFAITLILGLLLNLFTAVYVARVIFDVAERRRWITELQMMQMFAVPNINFVRYIKHAVVLSLLVIVGGLVAAVSRGEGLFGIDFTGGTSVQIVLREGQKLTVGEVREIVNPANEALPRLEDVTVSSVGLPDAEGKNRYYKIDTSIADIADVEALLKKLFGERLQTYEMSYTPLRAIPGAAAIEGAATGAGDASKSAYKAVDDSQKSKDAAATNADSDATKQTNTPENEKSADGKSTTDADSAKESGKAKEGDSTKTDTENTTSPKDDNSKAADDSGKTQSSKTEKTIDSAKSDERPQASVLRRGMIQPWLAIAAPNALALLQNEKQDDAANVAGSDDTAKAQKDDKAKDAKANDAQADDATDKSAKQAASDNEAKTEKGSAEASKESKPAVDSASKDKPAAPPLTSTPSTAATASKQPERSAPLGEKPAAEVNPFAGGSSTTLNFTEGINEDTLLAELQAAARALQLVPARFQADAVERTRDELNTRLFRSWNVQTTLPSADTAKVLTQVQSKLAQSPILLGANNIGGKVAGHARVRAVYAILASMVIIVIYVWVRFQNIVFGLASVVAIVHDVLVTVAALAISYYVAPFLGWAMVDPFKISLDVVAALLTIVGFSINDTIVIFDRIREIKGKSPEVTADMVNKAVNQTLGRTVLTNGTVLIVTIILYIWAGQEIHAFAFAMLVGIIAGTYSTIYIASPLVLWLRKPSAAHRPASPRGTELAMRV
jgi:SecD/SecF fusion protein